MKKLIILMMLLFSVSIFAEKLTTDGKNNLDKLKGYWGNEFYQINSRGNIWYLGVYDVNYSSDSEYLWFKLKYYKNGIFIVEKENYLVAYDTKYKSLVKLDKSLNIIEIISKKMDKPVN